MKIRLSAEHIENLKTLSFKTIFNGKKASPISFIGIDSNYQKILEAELLKADMSEIKLDIQTLGPELTKLNDVMHRLIRCHLFGAIDESFAPPIFNALKFLIKHNLQARTIEIGNIRSRLQNSNTSSIASNDSSFSNSSVNLSEMNDEQSKKMDNFVFILPPLEAIISADSLQLARSSTLPPLEEIISEESIRLARSY